MVSDAHRDSVAGHVLGTEKVACRIGARDTGKRDHTSATVTIAARLIESDVTVAIDTQKLKVDSARILDLLLVLFAERGNFVFRHRAVENVDVSGLDVDMVEQMLVHHPSNTLQLKWLHRKVLAQIERDHVGERQHALLVDTNEFVVNVDG